MIRITQFSRFFSLGMAGALAMLPFQARAVQRDYFADQEKTAPSFYTYADLADLALGADMVLKIKVKSSAALKPERSPGLAAGSVRLYIVADVETLIAGSSGVPSRVSYLLDVRTDTRGKAPKMKGQTAIVFARPVSGRPGELQLVAPDAQLPWTPGDEARIRAIVQEKLSNGAPPRITGIGDALHVPGNLIGESETQIFLDTSNGEPVSLTIIRRPGVRPQWGVSFSEIVDQAAKPPQKDSLAWYRLACFLPRQLPPSALADSDAANAQAAARDYYFVRQELGDCIRTRATQ